MSATDTESAAGPQPPGWFDRLSGEYTAGGLPLNATTPGAAASLVVKAGAGTLFALTGYSANAGAQFVLVFDAADVPANGTVPDVVLKVATVTSFQLIYGRPGRAFHRGIVVCNSSTAATLTIGAADCQFDAQYE